MPEVHIKESLNKEYLKVKISRPSIELFKDNFIRLIDNIKSNISRREDSHKTDIRDFLKDTWYKNDYYMNIKGDIDLAIYEGKDENSPVSVIIETKSLINKSEMITVNNLQAKAMYEILLYYFIETIDNKNKNLKHLIITNAIEWFIFDATNFYRIFSEDTSLVRDYNDFQKKQLLDNRREYFYDSIAPEYIKKHEKNIKYVYFNIETFEPEIRNNNDDNKLISLYKLLSPENMLRLPFSNDSNNLNNNFYSELLYIMGLCEVEIDKKKVIERNEPSKQVEGSLIENVIFRLENRISNEKELFETALELVITWINRILFLKLLESQLLEYNDNNTDYLFLNINKLKGFDDLNILFFKILAVEIKNRPEKYKKEFSKVPYLNSSLFDVTDMEKKYFEISNIKEIEMPVFKGTVLKNYEGTKIKEKIRNIDYIFDFLNAYDFSSVGSETITEEKKTLINASVLGLIFEKINGYKEGSHFTPGLITTFMCKEVIRNIVLQKFNDMENYNAETYEELKNYIDIKSASGIKRANEVINSIKICDPAVGSGHFLVSALNEIIAVKSDLDILADEKGIKIRNYTAQVVNDELLIFNDVGDLFKYNKKNKELQNIQKIIFNEKRRIIENSLFGVDINQNSVKICRLRLWIELLKNAFYTETSDLEELETLPNLDINIKCGNSLVSRFATDIDLKEELQKLKYSVKDYQEAVKKYKNASVKSEKDELIKLVNSIKDNFRGGVYNNMELSLKKERLHRELSAILDQKELFELNEAGQKKKSNKIKNISDKIQDIELQIENFNNSIFYNNSFEWRFEFPEVLNNDGDFLGFDAIIGNPPYVFTRDADFTDEFKNYISKYYFSSIGNGKKTKANQSGKINLFAIFIIKGLLLCKNNGTFSYIIPNNILRTTTYDIIRKYILENTTIKKIVDLGSGVFDKVTASTVIMELYKEKCNNYNSNIITNLIDLNNGIYDTREVNQNNFLKNVSYNFNIFSDEGTNSIINNIEKNTTFLEDYCKEIIEGIVAHKYLIVDEKNPNTKDLLEGKSIKRYGIRKIKSYLTWDISKIHRTRPDYVWEAKKKIITQRVSGGANPLIATLDTKKHYTFASVNNIILKDEKSELYEYILALLNSSTLNWYYANNFSNNSKLTVNISKTYLSKLPIPAVSSEKLKEITEIVKSLLKENSEENHYALITKLNKIIYELYGLSKKEIAVIENATVVTKAKKGK